MSPGENDTLQSPSVSVSGDFGSASQSSSSGSIETQIVRQQLQRRAEEIAQTEYQKACNRLQARGSLTSEEREIISTMATAIAEAILADIDSSLETAPDDSDTAQTVATLFELE